MSAHTCPVCGKHWVDGDKSELEIVKHDETHTPEDFDRALHPGKYPSQSPEQNEQYGLFDLTGKRLNNEPTPREKVHLLFKTRDRQS